MHALTHIHPVSLFVSQHTRKRTNGKKNSIKKWKVCFHLVLRFVSFHIFFHFISVSCVRLLCIPLFCVFFFRLVRISFLKIIYVILHADELFCWNVFHRVHPLTRFDLIAIITIRLLHSDIFVPNISSTPNRASFRWIWFVYLFFCFMLSVFGYYFINFALSFCNYKCERKLLLAIFRCRCCWYCRCYGCGRWNGGHLSQREKENDSVLCKLPNIANIENGWKQNKHQLNGDTF